MRVGPAGRGLLAVLAAAGALDAAAQVPAGPEFRVDASTSEAADDGHAVSDARGNVVVVWHSRTIGTNGRNSVFGRRFDSAGAPVGVEFRLNAETTLEQMSPRIAGDADGRFIVAWTGAAPTGGPGSIYVRRFGRDGAPLGVEFRVSDPGPDTEFNARLSMAPGGEFVVVWAAQPQQTNYSDVFGQRFDAAGARVGGKFQVNTYTPYDDDWPSVGHDASGAFTVTWNSNQFWAGVPSVKGRRYDPAGQPLTGEFVIGPGGMLPGSRPELAMKADGGFVVTWDQDYSGVHVMARIYGPQAPEGPAFRVGAGSNLQPPVGADARGDFTVTWSLYGGGSYSEVRGRRFGADGSPRGLEWQVNTYTTGPQRPTAVASDPQGNFTVVWNSGLWPDLTVRARRFGGLRPAAMDVDSSGNGVLEPGESVDVRPSWRNVNGAAQTFGSAAVSMTGPPGATYTITDGAAAYGTVPNGATARCAECLAASVSSAPSRPALDWDAVLEERITPDAQGQHMPWRLHVGRSFTDVPSSSPFYRFVETLLHRGVTAGCTAVAYCPGSPTLREQMAAFVLLAREGAAYAPMPCGTPVFADVPASSPFCRWIEELARRGVVSGCGGGNYCPEQAVTREQMAVFVLRTLDPALDPPACATPAFDDVPASSPFCRWIEELARRGVVSGCGGGKYCPADAVTREQMGVFIAVTFGLTLYGP